MPHPRASTPRFLPCLVRLEDRCVPAGQVSAVFANQVLTVTGTDGDDRVVLRQHDGALSIDHVRIQSGNALLDQVPAGAVARIDVQGLGGDDHIDLNDEYPEGRPTVTRPASLSGGDGNDFVRGGAGDDRVSGGAGGDVLDGGQGADSVNGGAGNDTVYGGGGGDRLAGSDGNDTVHGGVGADALAGEGGADALYGGPGVDNLNGGAGNDGLFGGFGPDRLRGGPNADRFLVLLGQSQAVVDYERQDAFLPFRNGDGVWTEAQILRVDIGLAKLHARTNNTVLLKRADGRALVFAQGGHSDKLAGTNSEGLITLYDGTVNEEDAWHTVIHEVGHNFDTPQTNPFVPRFRDLSGWTRADRSGDPLYLKQVAYGETWWRRRDAVFATQYASTNPYDDLCETLPVALGMPVDPGWGPVPAKVAVLDEWMTRLSS